MIQQFRNIQVQKKDNLDVFSYKLDFIEKWNSIVYSTKMIDIYLVKVKKGIKPKLFENKDGNTHKSEALLIIPPENDHQYP